MITRVRCIAPALAAALLAPACAEPPPTDTNVDPLVSSPLPSPRSYTALVHDAESRAFVALGGTVGPPQGASDEVWASDPSGLHWRLAGRLEPARGVVTAAYHAGVDRIVVWFSTRARPDGGGNLEPFQRADAISETWTYDLDEDHWEQVVTAVSPPPGLAGARMSYDAQSRKLVLFGGYDLPTGTFHDRTWVLDLDAGTWTDAQPVDHPTGRNFHGQTYHAGRDRVVVIGGIDVTFEPTNHVWAYDVDGNTWTRLPSPGAPARDYVSLAYADESQRIVLHGGLLYGPDFEDLPQDDTWEYDLRRDRWQETRLDDEGDDGGSSMPGPKVLHAMAGRSGTDQVVLFGGGPATNVRTSEVWRYGAEGDRWHRLR